MMLGSVSATSISSIRPPMLAGPIDLKVKGESKGLELVLNEGCGGAPPPRCAEAAEMARSGSAGNERRRMEKGVLMPGFVLGFGGCASGLRDTKPDCWDPKSRTGRASRGPFR